MDQTNLRKLIKMRYLLLMVLLAAGCASGSSVEGRTLDPRWDNGQQPFQIAYACSNNARLCSAFIADLNSKSLEQIRYFLGSNRAAWSETASEVLGKHD